MTQPPSQPKVTFWQMLRDIFVTAINKGQLPTAIFGLILVIIFVRISPEFLQVTVKQIVDNFINGYLFGYALFVATLLGWFFHAKRLRKIASSEQKRIGDEKTKLQKRGGLGEKVKSSIKK